MKTPRELLLERHRAAEAKLDAVRESVVATVRSPSAPEKPAARFTLRDLVLSCRWHLGALGAAWLVVLFLNVDRSSTPSMSVAQEKTPAPRQLLVSLHFYRQQLIELLEPPPVQPAAPPPPRSQLYRPQEIV